MPFVKPELGQGRFWREKYQLYDRLFILQERRFWKSSIPYRIIITENNYLLAIADRIESIESDWVKLQDLCSSHAELKELIKKYEKNKVEVAQKLVTFFTKLRESSVDEASAEEVSDFIFDFDENEDDDLANSFMDEEDPMNDTLEGLRRGENESDVTPSDEESAKKKRVRSRSTNSDAKKAIPSGAMILLTEFKKEEEEANEPVYDKVEGWLSKQAVSATKANNTKLTNRYFCMERGFLFYFEITNLGTYSLANSTIDDSKSSLPVNIMELQKIGYAITLNTTAASMLIAATTEAELSSWKLALQNTFLADVTHKQSLVISSEDDDDGVAEKRGTVFVQLPNMKWKWCYVIVRNQELTIGECFERGFFPLDEVTVELTSEVSFVLHSPIKGYLHITAASSEIMERWIVQINKTVKAIAGRNIEKKEDIYAEDEAQIKLKLQNDREAIRLLHLVRDIMEQDKKRKTGHAPLSIAPMRSNPNFLSSSPISASSFPYTFLSSSPSSPRSSPKTSPKTSPRKDKEASPTEPNSVASTSWTESASILIPGQKRPEAAASFPTVSNFKIPHPIPKPKKTTFNILSLDGGGLRGIMNTILLARICEEFPDFLEQIDFFAGTSNGGMVAAGLAFGFTPVACRHLIELTGKMVFVKDKSTSYSTPLSAAKFSNVYLKILCDEAWGKNKLKDASKYLMCPAFLLDNQGEGDTRSWDIRFFHNLDDGPEREELASDVIMRTTAAPTYFPSYQTYVDGGMFAHDPSSAALILTMTKLGKPVDKIKIFSMGTGKVNKYVEAAASHNYGMYQWLPLLTNVLWDGMVAQSEFICRQLLGSSYYRVNPILKTDIALDEPSELPVLTQVAKEFDLTPTLQWIKENMY